MLKTLFADSADVATTRTDGNYDHLYNHVVLAGTLANDGDSIRGSVGISVVGSLTATRNLKLYFAGSFIFELGSGQSPADSVAVLTYSIIRANASTVRYMATLIAPGFTNKSFASVGELTGINLDVDNPLIITAQAAGQEAAAGDIAAKLQWAD